MDAYFKDLRDRIERAQSEGVMSRDVKLVFLGEILYASVRNDLTIQETDRLQDLVGVPEDWRRTKSIALLGDDEEYRRDRAEAA
jgi:hypothetical protein